MKGKGLIIPVTLLLALIFAFRPENKVPGGRESHNFNFDWKFFKGESDKAQGRDFDDSDWRILDLPHDWSIEGPFSKENSSCTGYLPGGIAWYRKTFSLPSETGGRKVFIYFDGVYNNSEVWINGTSLGKRPNGYISFQYDLTPYLLSREENLLAVRVDHTLDADSRWYTGSGIYRDVKLIITDPVHIGKWGVNYTTPLISRDKAELTITTRILNETGKKAVVSLINTLWSDAEATGKAEEDLVIPAGEEVIVNQTITISNPHLWDLSDPFLYNLVTELRGKKIYDNISTRVGFRTINFDAEKGFSLNGKGLKLKGICMHHDAGTLGSAVPKQELSRRLDLLKELGCNAIRTSHNPFSTDFMELCDEKGFLVIGEIFDEWELPKKKWLEGWNAGTPGKEGYAAYFSDWWRTDLRDFILRDRNHPSLIMWSIGNEVDYPNDPYSHPILNTEANPQTWAKYSESLPHADRLGVIARQMRDLIKELDLTRPVTAGLASALMSNETGYAAALDVAGYNYQEFRYEPDHKKYPGRPLYGSENGMTLEMWNYVADNEYVMGQFLWTGFEYLGEAGRFPSRHSTSGIIDLAGNRKPEFFFRQSLWSDKPMVFLGTTDRLAERGPVSLWAHKRVEPVWNWEEGKMISINAFTNCEEVELFLNARSLGSKRLSDFQNRTISWELPFERGKLKAVARNDGKQVAEYELVTTGEPSAIIATCRDTELKADNTDLTHIWVTLCDEAGNVVYNATNEITCDISGPVKLLGMEDANPVNTEDYKDKTQKAFHGRLLVYLQATEKEGRAVVNLSSPGLKSATVTIDIKSGK